MKAVIYELSERSQFYAYGLHIELRYNITITEGRLAFSSYA